MEIVESREGGYHACSESFSSIITQLEPTASFLCKTRTQNKPKRSPSAQNHPQQPPQPLPPSPQTLPPLHLPPFTLPPPIPENSTPPSPLLPRPNPLQHSLPHPPLHLLPHNRKSTFSPKQPQQHLNTNSHARVFVYVRNVRSERREVRREAFGREGVCVADGRLGGEEGAQEHLG